MKIRKIISLILTFCMLTAVVQIAPATAAGDAEIEAEAVGTIPDETDDAVDGGVRSGDSLGSHGVLGDSGIEWTFDENTGTLTLRGKGGIMPDYGAGEDSPFWKNRNIKHVIIEDGVQTIGDYAFFGCGVRSVSIPSSVCSIGAYAFYNCSFRDEVQIPEGVEIIGIGAFESCIYLRKLTVAGSVRIIDSYAFYQCLSLTSLTLQDGIGKIGEKAFFSCKKLTELTIPDSVTYIGEFAFASCDALETLNFKGMETDVVSDDTFLGTPLERSGCGKHGDYYWEYDADTRTLTLDSESRDQMVGSSLFYNNTRIKTLIIGDGFDRIGDESFAYCSNLEEVRIGTGMERIHDRSFDGCEKLQVVVCSSAKVRGVGVENFLDGFPKIYGYSNTMLSAYTDAYGIDFESIGAGDADLTFSDKAGDCDYTFDVDSRLLTITGTGLLGSPKESQWFRAIVADVIIEEGPTAIRSLAISNFDLVKEINIPDSVTEIRKFAFLSCASLETLTFGSGVTTLGEDLIGGVDNYYNTTLICDSEKISEIDDNALPGKYLKTVYGRKGSMLETYCKNKGVRFIPLMATGRTAECTWVYEGLEERLTVTGDGRMRNYPILSTIPWKDYPIRDVIVGKDVTFIGQNAFTIEYMDHSDIPLRSIMILNADCEIFNDSYTLSGIPSLEIYGYSFSKAETYCKKYGYRNFKSMSETGITGEVQWYYDDSSRTVTVAGEGTMANYKIKEPSPWKEHKNEIEHVVILDGVKNVGAFAFADCTALKSVTLASTVEAVSRNAFSGCKALNSLLISEGVETIAMFAFYDTGLTKAMVPASVHIIGTAALGAYRDTETGQTAMVDGFALGGYPGTAAETYASGNGLSFIDRNKYCFIQYVENGGVWEDQPMFDVVERNTTYIFPECAIIPPTGYAWSWWNVNDTPVVREGFRVEHDCVISPAWGRACTIEFDPGEGGSGAMEGTIIGEGAVYTLPECTFTPPEGWRFDCWAVRDEVHGLSFLEPGDTYGIRENVTFTARWTTDIPVTVYPGFGATGMPIEFGVEIEQMTDLPSAFNFTPKNPSYKFGYWIVTDTDGRRYRADASDRIKIYSKTTITGVWWAEITYDGNGGMINVPYEYESVSHCLYGQRYQFPYCEVVIPYNYDPNMVFAGWEFNGKIYQPTEYISYLEINGPTTIKAVWQEKLINVHFDPGVGTGSGNAEAVLLKYGDELTLPNCGYTPPEGMAFTGWHCSSGMYANNLQPGQTIKITFSNAGELTFTAQYSRDITVRLDLNGHEPIGGAITADRVIPYGGTVDDLPDGFALGEYLLNGFIFRGWFTDRQCTAPFDPSVPLYANTTLYAKWEEGYTVTFWYDGEQYARLEAEPDGTVTPPAAPDVAGSDFIGWYDPSSGGYLTSETVIDSDKNVHAEYRGRIVVSFDEWNETELIRGNEYWFYVHIEHDELLPWDTAFVWESSDPGIMEILNTYESGWSNYAHVKIADNAAFDSTVTLTFTAGEYSVKQTYHVRDVYPLTVNDVEVTEKNREDILGDGNISFDGVNTLTLKGGTYVGGIWSRLAELKIDVQSNTTFNNIDDEMWTTCRFDLGGNVTVTGAGELRIESKNTMQGGAIFFDGETLIFDNASVTVKSDFGIIGNYGEKPKNIEFINSNVELDTDFEALRGFDGSISLTDSELVEPKKASFMNGGIYDDDSMMFWNKARIIGTTAADAPVYTVSFDANGHGSDPADQAVTYGHKAFKPSICDAPGWTLDGWFTERECENKYDFSTPVSGSITLYAKWSQTVYTVTFHKNGLGDAPDAQYLTYGQTVARPADLTAEGFIFGGWFADKECTIAYDFSKPVTSSLTLYAKWTTVGYEEKTDAATGIKVEAPEDTVLIVEAVEPGSVTAAVMGSIRNAYRVRLQKGGADVEPDGFVTVKIPCPSADRKIYRVQADNSAAELSAEYADGYMVFNTDTLGLFLVVDTVKYGDATGDGVINGRDLIRLRKYLAAYDPDTGTSGIEISAGADANGDGVINGRDLIRLRKYLAEYDENTGESPVILGPTAITVPEDISIAFIGKRR